MCGFGTILVGPVSTSYLYRIWKSGSVAGSSHVLRVRVSLHHLFEPNFGVHVPSKFGSVSASKYGGLPFGSHALNATGGRVRDLIDVVGRLGNASRREPTLACGVSATLETDFGNTCGTLALERFGPWDAL
ncbi:hypothetical protein TNCV_674151 [Trichonephila clavipes]|uniref:Uncharacterized protein n=1 Tax=Trichonephila clavipes TaxID=2585209 RepID=A0A8X6WD63_TRICX|nr:hypothetical protein TNCV_674151 [Trichonephila clavipes]